MTVTVEQAYDTARRVTQASGSSFYLGMKLLPPDRREALFAIYAVARRIDDIADGHLPADRKLAALADFRAELDAIETTDDPLLVAVADAARRYPIPLEAFRDLVEGAEADARGTRYDDFPALEHYCRCVAGSIGRLCVGVFDASDRPRADALAGDLGVALQLGNILRDLVEDLRNGRVYLPAADLARFGCRVDGASIAGDAELVVAFEAERALGWLERGLGILPLLDRRSARCVRAMTAAYERMLTRIAEHPDRALSAHARLGSLEKRAVVARSLLRGAA
jgi:phytoene synthase